MIPVSLCGFGSVDRKMWYDLDWFGNDCVVWGLVLRVIVGGMFWLND